MEDEEEVQSHPSGASGSPGSSTPPQSSSQRSNGRITVTVAAVPPQSQNNLTLALPIQRQQQQAAPTGRATGNSGGGGGGREDCWSEGATAVLIDAWGERYLELSRGNLKQKHWKDVADIVSGREDYTKTHKTDIQCKNRIDTVKKKYKLEKAKIAAGGAPSKWPFFERLDRLIGPSAKVVAAGPSSSPSPMPLPLPYSGSSSQRVPMGIPMGARSAPPHLRQQQPEKFPQQQQQKQKQLLGKRHPDSDEEEEEESEREPSPDSADDFPPGTYDRKRPRNQREFVNLGSGVKPGMMNRGKDEKGNAGEKNWGNAVRELTQAILKFGEAYEQAETLKLQQLVDMEKQRMKFAKEMELQRMQFFMKTQLELSQLKSSSSSSRRVGNSNNHRGSNNNVANNNNINNSDSSN